MGVPASTDWEAVVKWREILLELMPTVRRIRALARRLEEQEWGKKQEQQSGGGSLG